jgi:hypothetical protein
MQGISLFFGIPGCRNAEMSQRLFFGFSCFMKSGCKGCLCSLESLVVGMLKCPSAYSFRFSRFMKSGCKGYLCPLESPITKMPKCRNVKRQNALAFDQCLTIIPGIYGPRPTSLFHYFTIQGFGRQGPLSFQLVVPKITKWINGPDLFEIDGHYSS